MINKIKISILEAINLESIALLNDVSVIDYCIDLPRSITLERVIDSDVIIIKSITNADKELIDSCRNLKIIARAGTGTDNIDLEYAKKNHIQVYTVPTGNTISCAEFSVMNILMLSRKYHLIRKSVEKFDFRRSNLQGRELQSLTVGIVGVGNVGIEVITRLASFGCEIVVFDPYITKKNNALVESLGCLKVHKLNELFSCSDIISLHARLYEGSEYMINSDILSNAKPGLMLVNTARGKLIDSEALITALDNEIVSYAALDVIYPEPLYENINQPSEYSNTLVSHEKVIYTPHIAASTIEAQKLISNSLILRIKNYYYGLHV